jgi:hypothetical protein
VSFFLLAPHPGFVSSELYLDFGIVLVVCCNWKGNGLMSDDMRRKEEEVLTVGQVVICCLIGAWSSLQSDGRDDKEKCA